MTAKLLFCVNRCDTRRRVYKERPGEDSQQFDDCNYSTIMCDSDKCNKAPGADRRFENKSLGDKAKDMASHAKEEVKEGWDKMTGKTPEDRAAKDVKKTADNCAHQMKESREAAAEKMREGARHIEGH